VVVQYRRTVGVFRIQIFAQGLVLFNEGFGGFLQYLKLNDSYESGYWEKKRIHVLSTIVQMLDVITSFNCNCYPPPMMD
jgi:hypothetical protein